MSSLSSTSLTFATFIIVGFVQSKHQVAKTKLIDAINDKCARTPEDLIWQKLPPNRTSKACICKTMPFIYSSLIHQSETQSLSFDHHLFPMSIIHWFGDLILSSICVLCIPLVVTVAVNRTYNNMLVTCIVMLSKYEIVFFLTYCACKLYIPRVVKKAVPR